MPKTLQVRWYADDEGSLSLFSLSSPAAQKVDCVSPPPHEQECSSLLGFLLVFASRFCIASSTRAERQCSSLLLHCVCAPSLYSGTTSNKACKLIDTNQSVVLSVNVEETSNTNKNSQSAHCRCISGVPLTAAVCRSPQTEASQSKSKQINANRSKSKQCASAVCRSHHYISGVPL